MADIEVKCENCGNLITVSQFVDSNSIVCRSCGEKVHKPESSEPEDKAAARKPRVLRTVNQPVIEDHKPEEQEGKKKKKKKPRKHKEKTENAEVVGITHHWGAWVIFVVLGLVMGTLRYGDLLSPSFEKLVESYKGLSVLYAAYVVIAFQIIVLMKAFKDNIFQGILCLLVPGYSLYYLFSVSDDFYLRAVLGGFLVGIAQDGGVWACKTSKDVYEGINAWLASGG